LSQGRYRLGRWLVIASLLGWVDLARAGSASEAGAEPSSAKAAAPSEPGLPPGGDAHEQARVHLAEGNRLFRAADYDGAVREYRAAHELVPSAKLHFNIGLAEKMRGNPVQAARELDQFLADASTVDPGLRADASRYLDELAGMVATVNVHLSHPSLVTIDGAPIESPAVQRPLRLTPGRHDIAVRRVAAPAVVWGRALELVAGTPLTVVPELETPIAPIAGASSTSSSTSLTSSSPEAEPAPAAGATPIYRRWWFWVAIAGVAGAGLTATAIWAGHNNDGCALQSNCVALVKGAP
jgi:hypothetical protein